MRLWTPTLRQRWLVTTLALTAGCSEQVSSTTTVSSLQPDSPTSAPALSSDNDEVSDAGPLGSPDTLTATSETTLGAVDAATSSATSVPEVNTSKSVEADTSGEAVTSDGPTLHAPEAGATVTVVDGQLPELSPWETGATCGIPIDNGPPLCDPVANCGCEDDRTCAYTPERTRLFTCVMPGDTANGDACDNDDACTRGSVCVSGLCAPTCHNDEDCLDAACVAIAAGENYVENLRVCSAPCAPLAPSACGEGATCANAPGSTVFTCIRQEASVGVNAACEATRDCEPGLGCASDGVCRSWCALSEPSGDAGSSSADAPAACPEDSECLPFDARAALGMCSATCTVPDVEGSECGLIPTSCGCESGETCQVTATGKTQCGVPGARDAMDWCSSNADCGTGLSCVAQLCRPICDPERLPCADGSGCLQANSGASPAACLGHCDPVHPDSAEGEFTPCGVGAYCSPGFVNIPALDESYCTRQSDTPADEGQTCGADLECENGFGCDAQTDSCLRWCRDTEDCGTGQVCDLDISPGRTGSDTDFVGFCRAL